MEKKLAGTGSHYYRSQQRYRRWCSQIHWPLQAPQLSLITPYQLRKKQQIWYCRKSSAAGGNGITYACDVSKEEEVIKMFADTIVAQFGTVDILVNNAGLQRDAKFTEMTLEQWNFVLAVNLTGQFLCAREAIKEFHEKRY